MCSEVETQWWMRSSVCVLGVYDLVLETQQKCNSFTLLPKYEAEKARYVSISSAQAGFLPGPLTGSTVSSETCTQRAELASSLGCSELSCLPLVLAARVRQPKICLWGRGKGRRATHPFLAERDPTPARSGPHSRASAVDSLADLGRTGASTVPETCGPTLQTRPFPHYVTQVTWMTWPWIPYPSPCARLSHSLWTAERRVGGGGEGGVGRRRFSSAPPRPLPPEPEDGV